MESVSQTRLPSAADGALALQIRHRVGSSVRRLTPGFGISGGAEPSLHEIVRMRLASGDLFPVDGHVWAARATGADVRGLRQPDRTGEAEYEVASDDRHSVFAHVGCFTVWRGESAAEDWRR